MTSVPQAASAAFRACAMPRRRLDHFGPRREPACELAQRDELGGGEAGGSDDRFVDLWAEHAEASGSAEDKRSRQTATRIVGMCSS